jgi:ankyrin repeat protein
MTERKVGAMKVIEESGKVRSEQTSGITGNHGNEVKSDEVKLDVALDQCCGGRTHNCAKLARRHCSACVTMAYCSKECQDEHWSQHKKLCKVWKQYKSSNGRDIAEQVFEKMQSLDYDVERVMIVLAMLSYEKHSSKLTDLLAFQGGYTKISLLARAASIGGFEVTKRLIELGAQDHITTHEYPPIVSAAYGGHVEVVKLLIDAGANVDESNFHGGSPIFMAAQQGHFEVVKVLIDAGANLEHKCRFVDGATPLVIAAGHYRRLDGSLDIVKILANAGANIDSTNDNGLTALMAAAASNQLQIAQFLINFGAALDLKSKDGVSALHIALGRDHREIALALVHAGADITDATTTYDTRRKNNVCGGPIFRCQKSASMECGGCHTMVYCSVECQRKSWPRHKTECALWKQLFYMSSDEAGRKLVELVKCKATAQVKSFMCFYQYEQHNEQLQAVLAYSDAKSGYTALDIAKRSHDSEIVKLLKIVTAACNR